MARKGKRSLRFRQAKLETSYLRLMPELPKLLKELAIRAERFDGSEPKTFIVSFERDIQAFAPSLRANQARIRRFFLFVLRKFATRCGSESFFWKLSL
jgi:hypothetical protein